MIQKKTTTIGAGRPTRSTPASKRMQGQLRGVEPRQYHGLSFRLLWCASVLVFFLALAGCGGGSSGSGELQAPSPPPAIVLEPGPSEGSYNLVLGQQPDGPVMVYLESEEDVTFEPANLRFGPDDWDSPQLVTVTVATEGAPGGNEVTVMHQVVGAGINTA